MSLVLITRPQPDASEYAAKVEAAGFKTLIEPVLKVEPVPYPVPDLHKYDALIFTSTNGVRLSPAFDSNLPVFTVGDRTAREARVKGFQNVTSAGGTASNLETLLKSDASLSGKRLLHIRGRHVSGGGLKIPSLQDLIVYNTMRAKNLSPASVRALKEKRIDAVTFFSARTARTFINLIQKHELFETLGVIKLLCISDSVLQSVRTYGWAGTYTSATPDAAGMLTLIREVCAK